MIIVAANAGGAWSPIGDITTTMCGLRKVSIVALIKFLIIPSLVCMIIPTYVASRYKVFQGETIHRKIQRKKIPMDPNTKNRFNLDCFCSSIQNFYRITTLCRHDAFSGSVATIAEFLNNSLSSMRFDSKFHHSPIHYVNKN